MSDIVISVENLWKQYRYGTISHATLHRDLQSWWARIRGKEDPNSRIGQVLSTKNEEPRTKNEGGCASDRFWALKDVSFEVKRGEVLGIIGKNGAGKSTLLKIMSRVTTPTKGQIKVKGRVASLLEVGTGFHPELTGRENIFLNGAILGMTKDEIKRKFDEIVAFAEVEKFIDTPVKRYSSGMYVRLAFAVAAHLEPEILVVDEVLAVGDAGFQKKCIGKMGEVAQEGRTVLFVSHNMAAIEALCTVGLLMEDGQSKQIGPAKNVVNTYQKHLIEGIRNSNNGNIGFFNDITKIGISNLTANLSNDAKESSLDLQIAFDVLSEKDYSNIGVGISLSTVSGIRVAVMAPYFTNFIIPALNKSIKCVFECSSIQKYIAGGDYIVGIWLSRPKVEYLLKIEDALLISLPAIDIYGTGTYFELYKHGLVPLTFKYRTEESKISLQELPL